MKMTSIAELVDLTGKGREFINKRIAHLEKTKEGRTKTVNSCDALRSIYRETEEGIELDFAAERARLVHHQANKVAFEEAVLRGELLRASDVERIVGKSWMAFRAKTLAIPNKSASEISGGETRQQIEDLITVFVEEALNELSGFRLGDYIAADVQKSAVETSTATESDGE